METDSSVFTKYLFKPDTAYEVSSVYCWHPVSRDGKEDTLADEMVREVKGAPAIIIEPIDVTVEGIINDVIEVLANANVSIFVTLEGMVIVFKEVQPSNA